MTPVGETGSGRPPEGEVRETPFLDDQLCFALYAASRAMTNAYRPGLVRLGLTYPQFVTLLVLWKEDGLGVAELAHRLRLDASTLSPLLKRMETMGLLERRRCAQDERRVTIHLTPAGLDLAVPATQVREEVAQRLELTPNEGEQMRTLALRLVHTLEGDVDRPTQPPQRRSTTRSSP